MNILYLDATRGLYGASRMMLTLLARIDRRAIRPYVALADDIEDGDLRLRAALMALRIPVLEYRLAVLRRSKYLNPRGMLFMGVALARSVRLLVRLIGKYRIDIVQSNTSTVLSGAVAARITGVPHVWHVHEIFSASDARVFAPLLDTLSTRVVAVSQEVARSLADYRPSIQEKLVVIRNGIDAAPFRNVSRKQVEALRQELGVGPEDKVVGMIGRIGAWKGEHNFVEMARLVSEQIPNVKFVVVGGAFDKRDYHLAQLHKRIVDTGLGPSVTVTGLRNDIPIVVNMLDVLAHLPDRPEPFGLVATEAMAAGKPVVAWATGGLSEIVCDRETGYLVAPGAVETAAERVADLLTNDRLSLQMGEAGARRVDREFSATRYAAQFEQLYQEIGRTTNA